MAETTEDGEQMLHHMWQEAENRFRQVTQRSLKRPLSLDQALRQVDKNLDGHDSEKQKKLRQAGHNTIYLIQLLGGLAAQGASQVFGPASMCFNALDIVLTIPQKIKGFHDTLCALLDELSAFMGEFKIYQRVEEITVLDLGFRRTVHELMIAFVDVCAKCVGFCEQHRHTRFLQRSKLILFNDDAGIQGDLDRFRRLSQIHNNLTSAVTLEKIVQAQKEGSGDSEKLQELLSEAALQSNENFQKLHEDFDVMQGSVEYIHKDATDRRNKDDRRAQVYNLGRKLGVPIEDDTEAPFQYLREHALKESGSWLDDLDGFNKWTDISSGSDPLLMIGGDYGCGKSVVLSAISQKLKRKYQSEDQNNIRMAMAFFDFKRSDIMDPPGFRDQSDSIQTFSYLVQALKSVAMQFANRDSFYAKHLTAHLNGKDLVSYQDTPVYDVFLDLFSATTMPSWLNTYYVLFLDGVEHLPRDQMETLVRAMVNTGTKQMKIAIAGSTEQTSACFDAAKSVLSSTVQKIEVQDHNKIDIERYIDYQIDENTNRIFNPDHPDMEQIKKEIREHVPQVAKGNFKHVQTLIDSVKNALEADSDLQTVRNLISESTLHTDVAKQDYAVRQIRNSLNSEELKQLNELLTWVVNGLVMFNLGEVEAILWTLMRRVPFTSIKDKIKSRFSKVFELENKNLLKLRDPALKDYFRRSPRLKQTKSEEEIRDEARISMQITITNAKVSQVKRFFWDLSEQVVMANMDSFIFTEPMSKHEDNEVLGANPADGMMTILRCLFDLLLDEPKPETKALKTYATRFVLQHVPDTEDVNEKDALTLVEKQYIAAQLITLFESVELLELHFTDLFFSRRHLLDKESLWNVNTLLLDKDVMASFRITQRNYVERVIQDKNPAFVLEKIAYRVAKLWLTDNDWHPGEVFWWLLGFCNEIKYQETDKDGNVLNNGNVRRVEVWATQGADLGEKNAIWHRRIAETYHYMSTVYSEAGLIGACLTNAKIRFADAKNLDNSNWRICGNLAVVCFTTGEKDRALTEMNIALHQLRDLNERNQIQQEKFVEWLDLLARWQTDLNQLEAAEKTLEELIQTTPRSHHGRYELLDVHCKLNRSSKAIDFIRGLGENTNEGLDSTDLGILLSHLCTLNDPINKFEKIFRLTQHNEVFDLLLETLETLHDSLRKEKPSDSTIRKLIELNLIRGIALAHYAQTEDRITSAITRLRDCIEQALEKKYLKTNQSAYAAIRCLFTQVRTEHITEMLDRDQKFLNKVHDACNGYIYGSDIRMLLGSYYTRIQQSDKARDILLPLITEGFEWLSDDNSSNDREAFAKLSYGFLHAGDDQNALSAWQLMGPPQRHDENAEAGGVSAFFCDGGCNEDIGFEWTSQPWICRSCDDIQFCGPCLDKLRKGSLPNRVCSPQHSWILAPSWQGEFEATGKDKVRINMSLSMRNGPWQDGSPKDGPLRNGTQQKQTSQNDTGQDETLHDSPKQNGSQGEHSRKNGQPPEGLPQDESTPNGTGTHDAPQDDSSQGGPLQNGEIQNGKLQNGEQQNDTPQDGTPHEGEIVPISHWLATMRAKWGIQKKTAIELMEENEQS